MLQNPAILHTFTVPLTSAGVVISTDGSSLPLPVPLSGQILRWRLTFDGPVYVFAEASAPLSTTEAATALAAGQGIRVIGTPNAYPLESPPNGPGPFRLKLGVTPVSAASAVYCEVWTRP